MPLTASGKPIEHIQFFNGQRLFAEDLQDLEEFNRAMRWLHNQSLHQPGVASGYAVSGNKGDSIVTVQPGYAIDSQGREIVLEQAVQLQVPPVANDGQGNAVYYDLVVSYTADAAASETRDGVCTTRQAVRLQDAPTFCWVELVPTSDPSGSVAALSADRRAKLVQLNQDVEAGNRIRLARSEVLNCKLNQALSIAERRNARPTLQPYIAAANTSGSNTTKWTAVAADLGITLSTTVDTSGANFRSVPQYEANAVGDRSVTITIGGASKTLLLDGFVRIGQPTATSFQLSLLIPSILIDNRIGTLTAIAAALPAALQWYIVWMGVEG